jgi:hypothetical protein
MPQLGHHLAWLGTALPAFSSASLSCSEQLPKPVSPTFLAVAFLLELDSSGSLFCVGFVLVDILKP